MAYSGAVGGPKPTVSAMMRTNSETRNVRLSPGLPDRGRAHPMKGRTNNSKEKDWKSWHQRTSKGGGDFGAKSIYADCTGYSGGRATLKLKFCACPIACAVVAPAHRQID